LDRDRIAAIIASARPLTQGVSWEERSDEWVGPRPVTPDGLPLIGATKAPGVYVAGGHGMWGLTLGPVSGRLLAEEIFTGRRPEALAAFDPLRSYGAHRRSCFRGRTRASGAAPASSRTGAAPALAVARSRPGGPARPPGARAGTPHRLPAGTAVREPSRGIGGAGTAGSPPGPLRAAATTGATTPGRRPTGAVTTARTAAARGGVIHLSPGTIVFVLLYMYVCTRKGWVPWSSRPTEGGRAAGRSSRQPRR